MSLGARRTLSARRRTGKDFVSIFYANLRLWWYNRKVFVVTPIETTESASFRSDW